MLNSKLILPTTRII